jgi:hypothetical protein
MRALSRLLAAALALTLWAPSAAHAIDAVYAVATVERSQDPGFEGLYKYRIQFYWYMSGAPGSNFAFYVDLPSHTGICGPGEPVFASPAGQAPGSYRGTPCLADFAGQYLCPGDPDIPWPEPKGVARFAWVEGRCAPLASTLAAFCFYSQFPPAPPVPYPGGVAMRHGDYVTVGDIFGALPDPSGANPPGGPVVINEFVVRPAGTRSEYIELLNKTTSTIDISGWTLGIYTPNLVHYQTFPGGTTLPGHGFLTVTTGFYSYCPSCLAAPGVLDPNDAQDYGEDFVTDRGGVIVLRDGAGGLIDQVGYGNLGGAPVSCPWLRRTLPGPGVLDPQGAAGGAGVATEYDTTAVSTGRSPDGDDSGDDAADFEIGLLTPSGANAPVTGTPDLGSSVRLNGAYVFNPLHTAVQFYNPLATTVDIGGWYLSDGYYIRPLFPGTVQGPLDPAQLYAVYQGVNGEVGFQLDADSRLDLFDVRSASLVRVDQLGWMRVPSFFPDSCMVRIPPGSGPSGGWDWNTSGGFVTLFYVGNCVLCAPNTPVGPAPPARTSLAPPWPNPARGAATFAFTVGRQAQGRARVRLVLLDASGRIVRVLADRDYAPGQYGAAWDGRAEDGSPAPSGVYFARFSGADVAGAETRALVWLRP